MLTRSFGGALLLVSCGVAAACGSSSNNGLNGSPAGGAGGVSGAGGVAGSSAGGAAGGGGTSGKSGTGGLSLTQVQCGASVCSSSSDPSVEASACCTAVGTCGYRLPISPKCLATNLPGHVNPVCGPYGSAGVLQLPGCCSPTGCGARVTILGIGCVANPDLTLPPVACVFDTTGSGGSAAMGPADASPDAP